VTAVKLVCSTWKSYKPGERNGKTIYRHRFASQRFTCCIRRKNERTYMTDWELQDMGKIVTKLRPNDEVAVEVTGNTRLFYDAVTPRVKASRGGGHQLVPRHWPVCEKDGPQRRATRW